MSDDEAQVSFLAEKEAFINAPSLYPEGAELPTHPAHETYTAYIRSGIEELRRNEPLIIKMSRGQLFKVIHPCTQRIQTYGKFGDAQRITGPIDPRFLEWAGNCFLKLRAREAMLQARRHMIKKNSLPKKSKKVDNQPRRGDEFTRQLRGFVNPFKKLLKQFPSQYEEPLTKEILTIVHETFAEKREAHAARLNLHPTNGAAAP